MSFVLPLIIAFIAIIIAYNFVYKPYQTWRLFNKLPGPPAIPLFGNAHQFERDPVDFFKQLKQWGKDYEEDGCIRLWLGPLPVVAAFNAKDAEILLSSNKHITKGFVYSFLMEWLGTGLLTSTGQKWFRRRKMLTPTFHFRILADFVEIFNDQSAILMEKLQTHADGQPFDIFPEITLCVLDIICETAMGKTIDAQRNGNSDYVKAVTRMSDLVQERQKSPWLWPSMIYRQLERGKEYKRCLDILQGLTKSVIKERHEERVSDSSSHDNDLKRKTKRMAFLDLLLTMHDEDSSFGFEDIQEEVDTFMFEGHDTTAAASSWALYLIGLHPEVQKRVHEELDQVFESVHEPATMDKLSQLTYLGTVLKEALRIYPSVPFIARQLQEDCIIHGITFPEGSEAVLLIYHLHRDPKVFPDPERFDPDRFSAANSLKRHPYAYVPFSAGPRNCIGQKFAQLEEKVLVSTILRRFAVESTTPREEMNELSELILRPELGVHVKLTTRH